MKVKRVARKSQRGVRMSDTAWERIEVLAAAKEMRPSEYIRRIIEAHLDAIDALEKKII